MKGTIIVAALAVAVTLGLLVFVHESNRPAQPVEQSSAAYVLPAQGEQAGRALTQKNDPLSPQSESTTNKPAATNLWGRFAHGDIPRLTREQVEPFLTKNHRSVEALLGALRASGDDELLKEAKERFPNDPRVQFVQDQIDALAARRKAMRTLTSESAPILMSLSDEDTVHYFDRSRMYGEVAALRWVMNQAPQP